MTKEKFNWKGLFINEEEAEKEKKPEKRESKPSASTNSFPDTNKATSTFPVSPPKTSVVSNTILDTVVEMYEAGFESLNKPGYDFYEFFKAIKAVGSNDPAVYKMALTMAQSADESVTKSALLSQADFYIKEIERVHKQYESKGNGKRNQIINAQKGKKDNLNSEISVLEKKLIEIQIQVSNKKNQLQSLDTELMSDVSEIDQKIIANDAARSKILATIQGVANGIKNNI